MIKKSVILMSITIGLIVFSLSGCQTILDKIPFLNSARTPEPQSVHTPEPTTLPEIQPVLPPTTDQTNQLSLWLPPQFDPNNGTPAGEMLHAQLEKFINDHPGVNISVRIKAVDGSGGLLDSLITASAAAPAVLPGLILLSRSDLETAANEGLLSPVESTDLEINENDLFAYANNMAQTRGAKFGLPFAGDTLVLAYKPLQIGYPPVFWRDVIQQQSIIAFPSADPKGLIPLTLYQEMGGEFTGDEEDVMLQEVPLQRSLQVFSDGAAANIFPYWLTEYSTYEECWQALQESRATYAVIWVSQYLAESPDNISITSLPAINSSSLTMADGWVMAFPQTSPERYIAHLALAEYLLEPDFQQQWSEAAGVLPVSRAALSGWKDLGLSGILLPTVETAHLIPSNVILETAGPLLSSSVQELIRKQVSYIQASNSILKELSE